jgi:hypothetical protein
MPKITDNDHSLHIRFINLLSRIGFDTRYYQYCDINGDRGGAIAGIEDFRKALESTGLEFQYISKMEKLFVHKCGDGQTKIELRIAFLHSSIEMILSVIANKGSVGGPYHVLAMESAKSRNPSFAHSPPYPRLPYSNIQELEEALRFGIDLFYDIVKAIHSSEKWNT